MMVEADGSLEFRSVSIDADGATVEALVAVGDGPLVCTTHPFIPPRGNTAASLPASLYARVLSAAGRPVFVNPRGMGGSSAARGVADLGLARLVSDLEAVRRGVDVRRWVVAGGSSGANVALLYALAFPDAVAGLMLFSTGPSGPDVLDDERSVVSPRHPRWEGDVRHVAPLRTEPSALGRSDAEWEQVRPDLWCYAEHGAPRMLLSREADAPPPARHRAALEEYASFDVVSRLGEISAPTLVVCGGRDELIPLAQCERLARIPGAELVVLPESGHDLEQIEALQAVVARFARERCAA